MPSIAEKWYTFKRMQAVERIDELLSRGVAEVVDRQHLRKRLLSGKRLRIKLGIDPTGSQLHLGHTVTLRLLRRFQGLGHTAVLIIGDTTTMIGDPSGRIETRPVLSPKEIARNVATYERQAFKVLDKKRIEFRWQSEWYKKFNLTDVIREAAKLSAGWVLSHETFRDRMKAGQPLAFHELLYPLIQAYDSVAVKADVELGGTDQRFNILTGRELMRSHGLEPQDVVLTKLLAGTDGQKMGKSLNNLIALEEEPFEMFGQIMSMPDSVLWDYFELATDVPKEDFKKMKWSGREARNTKMFLARKIVEQYHDKKTSQEALRQWNDFVKGAVLADPVRLKDVTKGLLLEFLAATRITKSKSEAQRMIEQGGVKVNGVAEKNWRRKLVPGDTVMAGKKKQTYSIQA